MDEARDRKRASGPAYRIRTSRLILRCWNPEDAPLIHKAILENIDHLKPWMPWAMEEPKPLADRVELLRQFRGKFDLDRDYAYGVFNPDETEVLGGTGLHTRPGKQAREIGYWIHHEHLNQGLATELAAALTRVAFELDAVDRVEIHCDPENVRSAAIPRKLGYTHEATLRRRDRTPDGEPRDTMIWALFSTEYAGSPAARAEISTFDACGNPLLSPRNGAKSP